jgi:hypothetical protein
LSQIEFHKLCEICDRLLVRQGEGFFRKSIVWLHVVRDHPLFLAKYRRLMSGESSILHFVRRLFFNYLRVIRHVFRFALRDGSQKTQMPFDVVVVSHLLNSDQIDTSNDFYYGSLQQSLENAGFRVLVLQQNMTTHISHILDDQRQNGLRMHRQILPHLLSFREELKMVLGLFFESLKLMYEASRKSHHSSWGAEMYAAVEAVSPESLSQLRLACSIREIVKTSGAAVVLYTFEGHAWERLSAKMVRELDHPVLCIGYQHAAIFPGQHSMFRSLGTEYEPDYVLASGEVSLRICREKFFSSSTRVELLGSARSEAPNISNAELKKNDVCVVLPEGIPSECYLLFSASIDCAHLCPWVEFLWRLHPAMSFEVLVGLYPKLAERPANIKVSSGSTLDEDLKNSKWTLYRGSTACVSAIHFQSRPIYLESLGESSIDPMATLKEWKIVAQSAEEICGTFLSEDKMFNTEEYTLAKLYAQQFYSSLMPEVLIELVSHCTQSNFQHNGVH